MYSTRSGRWAHELVAVWGTCVQALRCPAAHTQHKTHDGMHGGGKQNAMLCWTKNICCLLQVAPGASSGDFGAVDDEQQTPEHAPPPKQVSCAASTAGQGVSYKQLCCFVTHAILVLIELSCSSMATYAACEQASTLACNLRRRSSCTLLAHMGCPLHVCHSVAKGCKQGQKGLSTPRPRQASQARAADDQEQGECSTQQAEAPAAHSRT